MRVVGDWLPAVWAWAALTLAACSPPTSPACQRYDAGTLVPENGFATSVPWDTELGLDKPQEHIEVALFIVRPVRGPIDLVHVIKNREEERWSLTIPDAGQGSTICTIAPQGGAPNCGATIRDVPHMPGGYYYLKPNGNTVLEAGLAFYLCK